MVHNFSMYFVYVLCNKKGFLYKGQTNDLINRIIQHNADDDLLSYTKKIGPWILVYHEECPTRKAAQEREAFLKTGKGRTFLREILKKYV